jgi:hypothetical protein
MKIVQKTPSLLILRLRPVILWIFGVVFASVGLFLLVTLGKVTTLTCTRTEPTNCQLVASGLLGSQSKQIPLNTLQGAKVEESSDSDGSTYRVIILTSSADVPFTSYLSSGEGDKQVIASHIEDFVKNPQMTSLKQEQDDRLWIYLIGGSFVIAGSLMLLAPVVTCVFDKTLDILTLTRFGLFGKRVFEHRLHEIKDVLLEESTDSENGSTYRVSIVLMSGDRQPLTSYFTSGRKSQQETASHIKSFLNLNN